MITDQLTTVTPNPLTALWAPNILIVGPSGSGKSSSLENLPQDDSTGIILTEPKALPFPNRFTNVKIVEAYDKFIPTLDSLKADPRVKVIVIDSISKHLERCLMYCRTCYKNYDIWTTYGKLGFALLNALSDRTKVIIALSIDESVEQEVVDPNNNGQLVTLFKRMAAVGAGNELKGKIEKEFTIVCHTVVKKSLLDKNKTDFLFQVKPSPNTTAKSPRSMFTDKAYEAGYVPNDLKLVLTEVEKKLDFKVF